MPLELVLLQALSPVHGDVVLEAALVGERLRAARLSARVRLLARVLAHVHLQGGGSDKGFVAGRAAEGALAVVALHVVEKVALRDKALAAVSEVAGVGALAGVRAHVRFQVALLGEDLLAALELAHVGERGAARGARVLAGRLGALLGDVAVGRVRVVREHVRVEVPLRDEVLAAGVALEGALAGVRAQVRLEVARLAERFLAVLVGAEVDLLQEFEVLVLWNG